MKNIVISNLLMWLFLLTTASFAQSDYEMVQSFKERNQNLINQIKEAGSIDELNALTDEIEKLKRDFSAKERILDKSLYPENFSSTIENLTASLELRRGDFSEIDVLKTEVTALKSEIDDNIFVYADYEMVSVILRNLLYTKNEDLHHYFVIY